MADILTDADYEMFRKLIYDESGITFSATNRSILDSRIKDLLHKKNLERPKDYFNLVISNKEELKVMLDSVTTNLTRFFRNQPHFDAFCKYVIPKLKEEKRLSPDKKIKIWSAGCSTGEEPFTIAMLMKEMIQPPYSYQITASDISLKSLMVGQQGFYADNKITGIPPEYLAKYFTKVAGGYQINKDILDSVRFDYHNLKNDSGARNLDVIFCRNVLIYFDDVAQKQVVDRFWNCMAPHSFLFIGHSESLFGMNTPFEFLKTEWACLYQKTKK